MPARNIHSVGGGISEKETTCFQTFSVGPERRSPCEPHRWEVLAKLHARSIEPLEQRGAGRKETPGRRWGTTAAAHHVAESTSETGEGNCNRHRHHEAKTRPPTASPNNPMLAVRWTGRLLQALAEIARLPIPWIRAEANPMANGSATNSPHRSSSVLSAEERQPQATWHCEQKRKCSAPQSASRDRAYEEIGLCLLLLDERDM